MDEIEPAAFEEWWSDKCPSGDAESVQRQWLESSDYKELFLDVGMGGVTTQDSATTKIVTIYYNALIIND